MGASCNLQSVRLAARGTGMCTGWGSGRESKSDGGMQTDSVVQCWDDLSRRGGGSQLERLECSAHTL